MVAKRVNKNAGFTLIEIVIVVVIIAVLCVILVPNISKFIQKSKLNSDLQSLRILNESTVIYLVTNSSPNCFDNINNSDEVLMKTLVDSGNLNEIPVAKQSDVCFRWNFSDSVWYLGLREDNGFEVTDAEVTMGTGGFEKYIVGTYSGIAKEIIIPKTINGVTVDQIYQDVFNNKRLTTVMFSNDSNITRIHARAFQNNVLEKIIFPSSLQRIDYGAFLGNNITQVTIGEGVYLEGNVFQNNNSFKDLYDAGGKKSGTYVYIDGNWIMQ